MASEAEMQEAFNTIDQDNSGKINKMELQALLNALNVTDCTADVSTIIDSCFFLQR